MSDDRLVIIVSWECYGEHRQVIQYKLFILYTNLLGRHCVEATIICGQPGHLELLPGEPSLPVHTV